jgi:thermostable 8-oxoguanine DNA glycosylase
MSMAAAGEPFFQVRGISRDPEAEVVPGVRWGRPEWVPSPAFWADLVSRASEAADGFVSRDATLPEEVGFCLLGGYGITAEINHAVQARMIEKGVYDPSRLPTADYLEALLRRPVFFDGRAVRYRFPRQRARRLEGALRMLKNDPPSTADALVFRGDLMRIPGIGPKTASWIARNWLGSDEVAILDIHIMRAGILMGLFDRNNRLPRDYERLERRYLEFCTALGAKPSLLDAVMWTTMRALGRGPV